uniref:Uncharacterized protein n=2 Tax=Kalanchoe fedtschenkoi TaxID=63787 RepID=A0A7N0UTI0_KALFE
MENQIVFAALILLTVISEATASNTHRKLFVFGDSYADTGNWEKTMAPSWKEPYGMTFPGKPSGRFSDGRVLTDHIASFLKIGSPVPYQWRRSNATILKHGMNFAYGGTGVFTTYVTAPNMTTQINYFQQIVDDEVMYTKHDLKSSIALVSLGGNDYGTYLAANSDTKGIYAFATSIMKQLELNLRRIHGLGVPKIVVTAIEPLGCLPSFTASSSYTNCSETGNLLAMLHNQLLNQTVAKLNEEQTGTSATFVILDLYEAFMSVFKKQGYEPGSSKSENILKPCCMGVTSEYNCGSVEKSNGTSMYTVCRNINSTFFWDTVHPAQSGWHAAYTALKPTLSKLNHHAI